MLVVVIGTGNFRSVQPDPMHFNSIKTCNSYASQLAKQFGNYGSRNFVDARDRVTTYCKAVKVDPNEVTVYKS